MSSVAVDWLVALAIAAPHFLYAYIWFFPHKWQAAFKGRSVDVFHHAAWALKAAQFSGLTVWILHNLPAGRSISVWAMMPAELLLGSVLVGSGQALNIGIYRAIGNPGVYYGFKLGHNIPWHTGFPFNVVSHPQYVGSALTVWGAVALLWTQAPAGLGLIALYWTALYALTALQESYF